MYKIYLDTSCRDHKSVKLIQSDGKGEICVDMIDGDIDVVSAIRNILVKNRIRLSDVSEVVPNLGPGSFTGLKIGVTVSNILNWVLKKKSIEDLPQPEYGGEPNIQKKW